jgi:hypothetical protein
MRKSASCTRLDHGFLTIVGGSKNLTDLVTKLYVANVLPPASIYRHLYTDLDKEKKTSETPSQLESVFQLRGIVAQPTVCIGRDQYKPDGLYWYSTQTDRPVYDVVNKPILYV